MKPKKINLALQGGGAHGAYTWGVLDRLLEEKDIIIEGISGTSAGAMNGAMLVHGFAKNGAEGAREYLETFWRHISNAAALSPMHKTWFESFFTGWNMDMSPVYAWFDFLSRTFSPYDLNPLNINPIRPILEEMLDFKTVSDHTPVKLFVTATHVASGQARVFKGEEISTETLLASACIPFIFQAVEVEGDYYWDGGYMGNPALWPLIYGCESEDVVLVQINPIHTDRLPKNAFEITNRLNEITFNSSLIAEMRAIDFVSRLLAEGRLERGRYKNMRMHLIYSAEMTRELDASSKMNAGWDFFLFLKEAGRNAAEEWLKLYWGDVGVKSTIDIREKFLCGPGWRSPMGSLSEKSSHKPKEKQI